MRFLVLPLALASAGCFAQPLATMPTNNAEIQVDLLFEHDGCRIYRFRDINYHYFAKCNGVGPNASILPDKCGKSGQECNSVPTF